MTSSKTVFARTKQLARCDVFFGRMSFDLETGAAAALEAFDVAVALERRHHDVEEPEEKQECRGGVLDLDRTTQLAADRRHTTHQHRHNADERACAEDGDGETETAGLDFEVVALGRVVDGCYRPRDADAKKHVDRVATGHVADR